MNCLKGDPGPGPDGTGECSTEIEQECENIIKADWLQPCVEIIETEDIIGACQVKKSLKKAAPEKSQCVKKFYLD